MPLLLGESSPLVQSSVERGEECRRWMMAGANASETASGLILSSALSVVSLPAAGAVLRLPPPRLTRPSLFISALLHLLSFPQTRSPFPLSPPLQPPISTTPSAARPPRLPLHRPHGCPLGALHVPRRVPLRHPTAALHPARALPAQGGGGKGKEGRGRGVLSRGEGQQGRGDGTAGGTEVADGGAHVPLVRAYMLPPRQSWALVIGVVSEVVAALE